MTRPPLWGNFIDHADEDFLAFGILSVSGLPRSASYHGTQAIEKYFKALHSSIHDPQGVSATTETVKWLGRTHNLEELAVKCKDKYPSFSEDSTLNSLRRLSKFDQTTRYPWVKGEDESDFQGSDIDIFGELILRIRNELPIDRDDYLLGMEVRGYFHLSKMPHPARDFYPHHGVEALRSLFPNINDFVRW